MIILSIDTTANICAACLFDTQENCVLAQKAEDLGRGHAERLLDLIEEVRADAGIALDRIDKIAVAVGPGSFTGIRVGVAAARGLALALDIPAVGVSTLHAIAAAYADQSNGAIAVALNGGRGQIFFQGFDAELSALADPQMIKSDDAANVDMSPFDLIVGNGAEVFGSGEHSADTAPVDVYERLGEVSALPPKPLYLRAADAKVSKTFALPIADQNV